MPVERAGNNVVGKDWICPEGIPLTWRETSDTRNTTSYNIKGISCFLREGELRLLWKGERIADVTLSLLDSGVEVWQLSISSEISSFKIPSKLIEQIKVWTSDRQDGDGLCQKIQDSCRDFDLDDIGCAAVGLMVYLLREGWTRI